MAEDDAPVQIRSAPKRDQLVEHDGKIYKTVQEGKAYILVPPNARTLLDPTAKSKAVSDDSQVQNVFYNPIQQFNRDLSVLAIKAFGDDLCRRKTLRHAIQYEKNSKRKARKRKRDGLQNGTGDGEEGGVKVPKVTNDELADVAHGETALEDEQVDTTVDHLEQQKVLEPGANSVTADREKTNGSSMADNIGSERPQQDLTATNRDQNNNAANGENTRIDEGWRPRFRILDALSASGLRALRYATEIPSATAIVANDRDPGSVKNIKLNIEHNKLNDFITATTGDAQGHMYGVAFPSPHTHGPNHVSGKYDVIDLDPYGTAAPFIDAALQALEDGSMLCVTCTDSGVFASCGYSEKTFSLYGGMPIKGLHSHEGGLRLILHSIATAGAKYGLSVEPLLSLSIDFYARLFVRVHRSAQQVKFLAGKTMLVYGCDHGCGAWATQYLGRHTKLPDKGKEIQWKYSIAQAPSADRLCEHCRSKMHVAGPMWGGPLHNPAFVEKMLEDLEHVDAEVYQTKPRIEGMLSTALDELSVNIDTMDYQPVATNGDNSDAESRPLVPPVPPELLDLHPFFFIPSPLCKVIKAQAPPENLVKGALRHAGHRVTRSHCRGGSIKTDAPWTVIWEVMREWVRQKAPIKEGALKEGQAGWKIMQGMRKDDEKGDAEEQAKEPNQAEVETNGTAAHEASGKRLKVVFDARLGEDKPGKRLVRYQMNPRENWGPMAKAKGNG